MKDMKDMEIKDLYKDIRLYIALGLAIAMSIFNWDGIMQFATDVLVLFVLVAGIFKLLELGKKVFKKGTNNGTDRTE